MISLSSSRLVMKSLAELHGDRKHLEDPIFTKQLTKTSPDQGQIVEGALHSGAPSIWWRWKD